jgi:hypothetical protein
VWHEDSDFNPSVYGTFAGVVDSGGVVHSAVGIPDSTFGNDKVEPAVAFGADQYLVVWGAPLGAVRGARIATDGQVLDNTPIDIADSVFHGGLDVAFGETQYLVAWGGNDLIQAARVGLDGHVIDPHAIGVSPNLRRDYTYGMDLSAVLRVAFGWDSYLVVWVSTISGSPSIYGRRVSPDGTVMDSTDISISTGAGARAPTVMFDGNDYLVLWEDGSVGHDHNIYGSRVSTEGIVLDPGGVPIAADGDFQAWPTVSGTGTLGIVAVYESNRPTAPQGRQQTRVWGNPIDVTASGVPGLPDVASQGIRILLNPIREEGSIELNAPIGTHASLRIYDICGRLVRTLVDGPVQSGNNVLSWDGTDHFGSRSAPGIYFIRMEAGSYRATKKVVLLR